LPEPCCSGSPVVPIVVSYVYNTVVLASGGREALLMNASSSAPFLITTTMKRSNDVSREELMDLLRKIAKEFYIHE
jgi:hypothetical protein